MTQNKSKRARTVGSTAVKGFEPATRSGYNSLGATMILLTVAISNTARRWAGLHFEKLVHKMEVHTATLSS